MVECLSGLMRDLNQIWGWKGGFVGEDVRAGGVIFIICRYCNLL